MESSGGAQELCNAAPQTLHLLNFSDVLPPVVLLRLVLLLLLATVAPRHSLHIGSGAGNCKEQKNLDQTTKRK